MKLTMSELIRAQDPQLAAIGVQRHKNAGWLRKTLKMDLTETQVEMFHKARRKPKMPKGISVDTAHNWGRPRLEQSGVGTLAITDRFLAGESVAILAEDYGVAMSEIEKAIRYEVRLKKRGPSDPSDAAENFANQLFEQSGRDLS